MSKQSDRTAYLKKRYDSAKKALEDFNKSSYSNDHKARQNIVLAHDNASFDYYDHLERLKNRKKKSVEKKKPEYQENLPFGKSGDWPKKFKAGTMKLKEQNIIEAILNGDYLTADQLFQEQIADVQERKLLEARKIIASSINEKKNDHDYDDPPFDPDKKKSTPWKNPHSKAKHLAREMMKKYKKKEDLKEAKTNMHPDHELHKAIIKAWHKPGDLPGGTTADRDAHINKFVKATRKQIDTAIKIHNKKHNLEE